jgi:hypothetical protein
LLIETLATLVCVALGFSLYLSESGRKSRLAGNVRLKSHTVALGLKPAFRAFGF